MAFPRERRSTSAAIVAIGMIYACRSSPAPAPSSDDQRVPLMATSRGPFAILPGPSLDWDDRCLARRGCPKPAKVLPQCAEHGAFGAIAMGIGTKQGTQAELWSEVAAHADQRLGQKIFVRGKLALQGQLQTSMQCRTPNVCCNGASSDVVLDSPVATLQLGGLGCEGDESQLCCDVLARGQWVLASGRLRLGPHHSFSTPGAMRWRLEDPTICLP